MTSTIPAATDLDLIDLEVLRSYLTEFVHDDHAQEVGRRVLEQRGDADL